MGSDDFSFPTTTDDAPPRFMESPPLWRTFSTTLSAREGRDRGGPISEDQEGEHFPIGCSQRKSFSCIERGGVKGSMEDCSDGDEEEKMDVLWEDFMNEEFSRSTCGLGLDVSPGQKVELGCVQALRLSRTGGGGVLSGKRRPGVVVFMKVLRKLFLLHNSSRKAKKHPCERVLSSPPGEQSNQRARAMAPGILGDRGDPVVSQKKKRNDNLAIVNVISSCLALTGVLLYSRGE